MLDTAMKMGIIKGKTALGRCRQSKIIPHGHQKKMKRKKWTVTCMFQRQPCLRKRREWTEIQGENQGILKSQRSTEKESTEGALKERQHKGDICPWRESIFRKQALTPPVFCSSSFFGPLCPSRGHQNKCIIPHTIVGWDQGLTTEPKRCTNIQTNSRTHTHERSHIHTQSQRQWQEW